MFNPGVGTVSKKWRLLTIFKRFKNVIGATCGAYAGVSIYSVHVSEAMAARNKALDEFDEYSYIGNELAPSRDHFGFTPLHWCCLNDDVAGLESILKRHSSAGIELGLGQKGQRSVPKVLARKRGDAGWSPRYWAWWVYEAVAAEKNDRIKQLSGMREINPVQCAALCGSTKVLSYLAGEKILDLRQRDVDGNSLLFFAVVDGQLETARMLLEWGEFDIDERDKEGYTLLQKCADNGRTEACKFLIKNGADVNAAPAPGCLDAIRLCEVKFDEWELEKHRGKANFNPFEECLEFLENHAEEITLIKKSS